MHIEREMIHIKLRVYIIALVILAASGLALTASCVGLDRNSKAEQTSPTVEATSPPETEPPETAPPLIDEPALCEYVVYDEPITKYGAIDYQDAITYYIDQLKIECDSGKYTDNAISEMTAEISRMEDIHNKLQKDIDRFTRWEEEYYYAATTWQYLRLNGYSEEVSAGIIGNMMVETSGGTLSLNPTIYGGNYYGLCQWSLYYKPYMDGKTFEEQLEFLHSDMPTEFNSFGKCYYRGFTYDDFLAMDDPSEAAYAFAKVYERCASFSYNWRKSCARKAYEYFTSEG